jgi:hypothetical protein
LLGFRVSSVLGGHVGVVNEGKGRVLSFMRDALVVEVGAGHALAGDDEGVGAGLALSAFVLKRVSPKPDHSRLHAAVGMAWEFALGVWRIDREVQAPSALVSGAHGFAPGKGRANGKAVARVCLRKVLFIQGK